MKSKEQKAKESQERTEKFQSLSPQDRWKLLDQRLGVNVGAKRQREKLIELCPELKPVQPKSVNIAVVGAEKAIKQIQKIHLKPGRVILR